MPKRIRKLTCPRCHRSIPKGELTEHMRQHKGKLPAYMRSARSKKPKKPISSIPSFEEFLEQHLSKMPVRSKLTEQQIRSRFEKALADVATDYKSLKLEPTKLEPIEVVIDRERSLTLKYNPLFLVTQTEEAIDALLLHEACHVATLPNSLIKVPDIGSKDQMMFLANYITNYDECLAHASFIKNFKNDKRYESLRKRQIELFHNFETIINSMKTLVTVSIERGLPINQFKVLEQLHNIAYDALFFYVAEDDSFLEWCKRHVLEKLYVFIGWLFIDFEHITNLGLSYEETRKKLIPSGVLSMSVNPTRLLIAGEIEFAGTTRNLHKDMIQKNRDTDLVKLWEKRRQLYEK